MLNLKGIFAPIPTSFDAEENLSYEKMKGNIVKLMGSGLSGLLIQGSNGEQVMLSETEKLKVFEAAREAIPGEKIMLAGTSAQSTVETIRLTRAASIIGADAALILPHYYYKGAMTLDALVKYYFTIAEAVDIPVIIYNMPANTGMDMSADIIAAIAAHENIIGLKDSGGNLVKMSDIRGQTAADFQILAGSAGFLLPALAVGAVGGIIALANIAHEACIEIYENFNKGNVDEGRRIQSEIIALNSAVTMIWGVAALKEAMDFIGLYGGPVRSPMLPLQEELKPKLHQLIRKVLKRI